MTRTISAALQTLLDAKVAVPVRCNEYMTEEGHTHEGGDRMSMGARDCALDVACHVELQHGPFGGSDYSGNSCTESNHRSLLREHTDTFIDLYGGFGSYGLALPLTFGTPTADDTDPEHTLWVAEDLASTLTGLANDYPLFDEDDEHRLIDERAMEAWDSYVKSDLESTLAERFGADSVTVSAELFWQTCSDHDIYPESEGHRDVIFRDIDSDAFLTALWHAVKGTDAVDEDDDPTPVNLVIGAAARLNRHGYVGTRVGAFRLAVKINMYPSERDPVRVLLHDDRTNCTYDAPVALTRDTDPAERAAAIAFNVERVATLAGATDILSALDA